MRSWCHHRGSSAWFCEQNRELLLNCVHEFCPGCVLETTCSNVMLLCVCLIWISSRNNRTRAKEFHEWAEKMSSNANHSKKPKRNMLMRNDSMDVEGRSAKIELDMVRHQLARLFRSYTDAVAADALSQLPKVDNIWEDFATRNLIVEMASHDQWFFHKKEAVSLSAGSLLVSNELRVYTMTLDSCVLSRLHMSHSTTRWLITDG